MTSQLIRPIPHTYYHFFFTGNKLFEPLLQIGETLQNGRAHRPASLKKRAAPRRSHTIHAKREFWGILRSTQSWSVGVGGERRRCKRIISCYGGRCQRAGYSSHRGWREKICNTTNDRLITLSVACTQERDIITWQSRVCVCVCVKASK